MGLEQKQKFRIALRTEISPGHVVQESIVEKELDDRLSSTFQVGNLFSIAVGNMCAFPEYVFAHALKAIIDCGESNKKWDAVLKAIEKALEKKNGGAA